MKPIFETIEPNWGTSFYMDRSTPGCCEPFWHIHPEYELVYVRNGSATFNIGSYHSSYSNGLLAFIGSNIPHSNLGNDEHADNIEVVIQMTPDFLESKLAQFPEFQKLSKLLERSKQGILFGNSVKELISQQLEELKFNKPDIRLLKLLRILLDLAEATDYKLLNADTMNMELQSNDYERIALINNYIRSNYKKQIQLSDMAALTGLTESSFSRFFKKITSKTFVNYLNEFRIQQACMLLSDKKKTIYEVMFESGFCEPAHFSRVFKKYSGHTPRDYKRIMRV